MGGFGSTRWGWRTTRATTDGLLALDVRSLARYGYFAAGSGEVITGSEAWRYHGEEVGRIGVHYRGDDPQAVNLEYQAYRPGEAWQTIRERVELGRTPCTFGGARRWFICPGCGRRCALLYCVGGLFRCRHCHDLAYCSTRHPLSERARRYPEKEGQQLGSAAR
jgi:hypothetical protein